MCLIGLRKRQQKLEQKIEMYETHIKMEHYLLLFLVDGKISMKDKISNQEWKDLRTRQLYSRGDKSKKGI